jgi:hypothetical protein
MHRFDTFTKPDYEEPTKSVLIPILPTQIPFPIALLIAEFGSSLLFEWKDKKGTTRTDSSVFEEFDPEKDFTRVLGAELFRVLCCAHVVETQRRGTKKRQRSRYFDLLSDNSWRRRLSAINNQWPLSYSRIKQIPVHQRGSTLPSDAMICDYYSDNNKSDYSMTTMHSEEKAQPTICFEIGIF